MTIRKVSSYIGVILLFFVAAASIQLSVSPKVSADDIVLTDAEKQLCESWVGFTLITGSASGEDVKDGDEIRLTPEHTTVALRCQNSGYCKASDGTVGGQILFESCDEGDTPSGGTGDFPAPPKTIPVGAKPLVRLMCDSYSGQMKTDCRGLVTNTYLNKCYDTRENADKIDQWSECVYKSLLLDWIIFKKAYPTAKAVVPQAKIKEALQQGLSDTETTQQDATKQECEDGGGTYDAKTGACNAGADKTSCSIDGIGWLICPVMNFLAELNEKAFGFLKDLLGIRPALTTDDGTRKAWSTFRDLANVAFVIAFLVIIYSQITSVGVSNYGIKKLLPKIAIAAIMVNLSLFFCQILVDISNIAGASLYSFISELVKPLSGTGFNQESAWSSLMGSVLIAGVGVLLVAMVVVAPTVLLALGLILLILVARQAFVLILIILSPLAFVAYLLPNTEGLFKKWWKALTATLLVYPIIAVVFGASTLASNILMGIASDQGNTAAEKMSDDNQMLAIVALAVMAVPLFAVPVLLKSSLSAAGTIGARLQGMADKSQGKVTAKVGQKVKTRGERYGNQFKAGAVGIGSKVSNSERFGRALGGKNSFRRRKLGAFASLGATSAVDNAERDKYAKVGADAAARNYVADTASSSASYARSLAGGRLAPGSADMAKFVESYAIQAKREEYKKDITAFRTKIATTPTSDFVSKLTDTSIGGAEKAAYAAEIAARGPGAQFHQAIEASSQIQDREERQKVQSELLSNMREEHFGVSDEMRGKLATGDVDASYGKDSSGSSIRKTASGGGFDTIYESSLDARMERKMNDEGIVSMKSHDMTATKELIRKGHMTDAALQRMVNSMDAAEKNPNTSIKIKGETQEMFNAAKALAVQRGITVTP